MSTINEIKNYVKVCFKSQLVPFIQGSPGLGKSAIIKEIAEEYNLELIDIRLSQCDPSDLMGFPKLDGETATYVPMDIFPTENTKLPKDKKGWIIFFDELNSAPKSVQVCAYKIILDRMVGQHKLNNNVLVCCAGNLATDKAVVNNLSTALRSRLVNLTMEPSVNEWLEYAINKDFHFTITAYIQCKGIDALYNFNPDKDSDTYACPRTWEMLNKIVNSVNDPKEYLDLVLGTVGSIGAEYLGFIEYCGSIPTLADVLSGNAKVPGKEGVKFLTCNWLLKELTELTKDSEITKVMEYIEKFSEEYCGLFLQSASKKNPKVLNNKGYLKLLTKLGKFLVC